MSLYGFKQIKTFHPSDGTNGYLQEIGGCCEDQVGSKKYFYTESFQKTIIGLGESLSEARYNFQMKIKGD